MPQARKPRGHGNYVITVTGADGTADAWCEPSKDQAIATARTYSALAGYAAAEVRRKTDGSLVGRYENNVLTGQCQHCGKGIRRDSKGHWGARKRDDPHPWYCDASPDAEKRHAPVAAAGTAA